MDNQDNNNNLLDDMADIVEEQGLTAKASDVDDMSDLEALLAESMEVAAAKKSKAQGRKLTGDQSELLEANRLAAEAAQWEEEVVVAHFVQTTCSCGETHKAFDGWFQALRHRRTSATRLSRLESYEGQPALAHVTEKQAEFCAVCLEAVGLFPLDPDDFPVVKGLGTWSVSDGSQLVLDLIVEEAPDVGAEMLEALEAMEEFALQQTYGAELVELQTAANAEFLA